MPLIDVTSILVDPDFAQDFTVVRFIRTVNNQGLTVDSPGLFATYGVILPLSGAQLAMLPEAERTGSYISVYTTFALYALTDRTAPDHVQWHGRDYLVRTVNDWTDWGLGFTQAVCQLTGAMTPNAMPC
jgi:galactose-6-phosphate isomerase